MPRRDFNFRKKNEPEPIFDSSQASPSQDLTKRAQAE